MKWEKKLLRNGSSLQIIIPKDLATHLNLNEGDTIIIEDQDQHATIKKGETHNDTYTDTTEEQ